MNFSNIRFFTVPGKYDLVTPQVDYKTGQWQAVSPEVIERFSAVAYFFAKDVHLSYDVPVGIILSAYGGSPAEAWMSEEALREFPHYLKAIEIYEDIIKGDPQNILIKYKWLRFSM